MQKRNCGRSIDDDLKYIKVLKNINGFGISDGNIHLKHGGKNVACFVRGNSGFSSISSHTQIGSGAGMGRRS
jgi:hypothetical protein